MPPLSIVVPAFNEGSRLAAGIGRLAEAVDAGAVDPEGTEVIVVDDGSTDGTGRAAAALLGAFPHHLVVTLPQNRGKGAAVRAGVARAGGAAVAYMDADMAIHPDQLPRLTAALHDADVAIGSRADGGHGVVYATRRRTLEGRAFNLAVNLMTGVHLPDTQCGFKAFRAPVARLLFGTTVVERFAFDMEVLAGARRLGLRIAQVPVRWTDVPGSRIRPLRDPASMLLDALRHRAGRGTPPVLVLEVAPADPQAVAAALAPAAWPVVARPGGAALVLVPTGGTDGTAEAERALDEAARRVAAAVPGASVRRRTLDTRRLRAWAPLEVVWGGGAAVGTMSACRAPGTWPPGTEPRP